MKVFSSLSVDDALVKDGLYSSNLDRCSDRRRGDSLHPLNLLRCDAQIRWITSFISCAMHRLILYLSVIAESSIENISTTRIAREVIFVVCVLVVHCACKWCQQ